MMPNPFRLKRSGLFLALMLVAIATACARAPDLIGIDNPEKPVASVEDVTLRKVFLASTRQETETAGALFSEERSQSLGLASVQVSFPPSHVLGELERAERLPPDPARGRFR